MRVNMNKTKVMISGESQKVRQKAVRCGVCSKGVGSNSLQCNSCQKWVHKKCSGINGSMSKVAKSFICSGFLNPVTSVGRTSVDIGASSKFLQLAVLKRSLLLLLQLQTFNSPLSGTTQVS